MTFSALLFAGILLPQKFQLILTNENCKMFSQKDWSVKDRRPSFLAWPITEVEDTFVRNVTLEPQIVDVTDENRQ